MWSHPKFRRPGVLINTPSAPPPGPAGPAGSTGEPGAAGGAGGAGGAGADNPTGIGGWLLLLSCGADEN